MLPGEGRSSLGVGDPGEAYVRAFWHLRVATPPFDACQPADPPPPSRDRRDDGVTVASSPSWAPAGPFSGREGECPGQGVLVQGPAVRVSTSRVSVSGPDGRVRGSSRSVPADPPPRDPNSRARASKSVARVDFVRRASERTIHVARPTIGVNVHATETSFMSWSSYGDRRSLIPRRNFLRERASFRLAASMACWP